MKSENATAFLVRSHRTDNPKLQPGRSNSWTFSLSGRCTEKCVGNRALLFMPSMRYTRGEYHRQCHDGCVPDDIVKYGCRILVLVMDA